MLSAVPREAQSPLGGQFPLATSSITFTGADDATSTTYIFAGNSLGFFPTLAPAKVHANDFAAMDGTTLSPGDSPSRPRPHHLHRRRRHRTRAHTANPDRLSSRYLAFEYRWKQPRFHHRQRPDHHHRITRPGTVKHRDGVDSASGRFNHCPANADLIIARLGPTNTRFHGMRLDHPEVKLIISQSAIRAFSEQLVGSPRDADLLVVAIQDPSAVPFFSGQQARRIAQERLLGWPGNVGTIPAAIRLFRKIPTERIKRLGRIRAEQVCRLRDFIPADLVKLDPPPRPTA